MSRASAAVTFAVVLTAGLALAVSPSPATPGAGPSASPAAKAKRCGHRYHHRRSRPCRGRAVPAPKPPKAKPRPKPSPAPSPPTGGSGSGDGSGSGGSGGGGAAPTPPTGPDGGASPGEGSAPPPAALPRRLGVDQTEYSVTPSYDPVAAGNVEFNVTNFGMDDHNLAIRRPSGALVNVVSVAPGQSRSFSVNLPAGTYTLFCSLYDHEQLGMRTTLRVQ